MLAKYNKAFGGKAGSAAEAHAAMLKEYGPKKGENVFYATKNARLKSRMPKGGGLSPAGDLGEMRQKEAGMMKGFKAAGPIVKASAAFKPMRSNAAKDRPIS